MKGIWQNLTAISPETVDQIKERNSEKKLVCFSLDKKFFSELELDHDYHKIVGSIRRINLGINELSRMVEKADDTQTKEKMDSLKASVNDLDAYASHLLTQLGRSLEYE